MQSPLHPIEVNGIWVYYYPIYMVIYSNDTGILVLSVQGLYYSNVHQELSFRNYLYYFEYFQFSDREKWCRHSVFGCFSAIPDVFQSDLELLTYTWDMMWLTINVS